MNRLSSLFGLRKERLQKVSKKGRKSTNFSIDKRQKFVIAVIALSLGLFFGEYQFSNYGLFTSLILSVLSDLFLLWAVYPDMKERFSLEVFILPFFYSLASSLFYAITPASFISHIFWTALYAFGLYSLFLSQNILLVSSIRTIQLLSGARIVSFVITLISFFFISNIVFTLHVTIFPVILIMIIYTFLLIYHSLWSYTLTKVTVPLSLWVSALTVCVVETATILWFWPSSPTVTSVFLTGFLYILAGLSHIWFEKRLFKGVLWEYLWVGFVVFLVLIIFTPWGK